MTRRLSFFKRRNLLLSFVVLVLVLASAALILRQDIHSMFQALLRADYSFVGLALFVYLAGLLIWSLRWHVTLSRVGYPLRLRSIFVIIVGGICINNVTPFTYAGGDPIARAYILKKTQKVPYHSGFATILTEFALDLPVYFSLLFLGTLLSVPGAPLWYLVLVVAIWLTIIFFWSLFFHRVLSNSTGLNRITSILFRVMKIFRRGPAKSKLRRSVSGFYSSSAGIIGDRRVVFYIILLTAILWTFVIARLFLIFQALGFNPPLYMLVFAATMPAIVGMIPFLPGGLGTVDATMVSVFLVFGAPAGIALSATLIERAITLVFSTLVGGVALSYLGIRHGGVISPKARSKPP